MRKISLPVFMTLLLFALVNFAPAASAELNIRILIAFTDGAAQKVDADKMALEMVSGWQTYLDGTLPDLAANLRLAGNKAQILALDEYRSKGGRVCSLTHSADLLAQKANEITEKGSERSYAQLRDDLEADITVLVTDLPAKNPVDGKVDVDYGLASEIVHGQYQLAHASLGAGDAQSRESSIVAFMSLLNEAQNAQRYFRDRRSTLRTVIDSLDKTTIEQDYARLLKQAKADPVSVNFAKLRALYSQSSKHAPIRHIAPSYSTDLREAGKAINKEKDFTKALKHCSAILDRHYLDIEGHFWCMRALEGLGRREQAVHHQHFLNGLLRTLYADGDGRCPEFPLSVVDMSEEFAVIYLDGFRRGSHRAFELGEVNIDYYDATRRRDGAKRDYFFDTNVLREGYQK